jgi:hypothetical protein
MWCVYEQNINKAPLNIVALLMTTIRRMKAILPRATMVRDCRMFFPKIKVMVGGLQ